MEEGTRKGSAGGGGSQLFRGVSMGALGSERFSTNPRTSEASAFSARQRRRSVADLAAKGLRRISVISRPDSEGSETDYDSEEGSKDRNTFIDREMMKEKVRKTLLRPTVTVTDMYKPEGCAQALARIPIFENLTLLVIAINAFWIAYDTDSNDADVLLEADLQFQVAENVFCTYFTLELLVRFFSYQRKINCLKDAWFVFDGSLVLMMILETWVMTAILVLAGSSSSGGFGDASIIRIARLLRLSRMARMARLLRVVPELMILIKGMAAAVRSVLFTIILLLIIMYVFAIGMTQLSAGLPIQQSHFTSVPATMYFLLMHGCLLDSPKLLSDKLAQSAWYLPPIFWVFVLMAALTVMNMLVGVLCEVVSGVAAVEKEENLVNFVKGRVRKIVEEIDEDGNMCISKAEFMQILENSQACRALQDVGVDVIGLVDFADTIFEDEQGREKPELSFPSFMDLILQLRGSNTATVKDIVELRKMLRYTNSQIANLSKNVLPQRTASGIRTGTSSPDGGRTFSPTQSTDKLAKIRSNASIHGAFDNFDDVIPRDISSSKIMPSIPACEVKNASLSVPGALEELEGAVASALQQQQPTSGCSSAGLKDDDAVIMSAESSYKGGAGTGEAQPYDSSHDGTGKPGGSGGICSGGGGSSPHGHQHHRGHLVRGSMVEAAPSPTASTSQKQSSAAAAGALAAATATAAMSASSSRAASSSSRRRESSVKFAGHSDMEGGGKERGSNSRRKVRQTLPEEVERPSMPLLQSRSGISLPDLARVVRQPDDATTAPSTSTIVAANVAKCEEMFGTEKGGTSCTGLSDSKLPTKEPTDNDEDQAMVLVASAGMSSTSSKGDTKMLR